MRKHSHLWPLLLGSCIGSAVAEPPSYVIRSEQSELFAFAGPDLRAPFWMFTDRHVVRAKQIDGSVQVDANDVTACRVELEVPSNHLEIDGPALRAELGWDELRPEDRASVRYAVEGESILWITKHPKITFRSERCRWLEDRRLGVSGILTIRGVEKPVEVPLSLAFARDGFEATGTFEIEHEDFGMQPYGNALGTIKIAHTITIVVRIVGVRASVSDLEV
jgi:polyisoprenoid-binding protein YceI